MDPTAVTKDEVPIQRIEPKFIEHAGRAQQGERLFPSRSQRLSPPEARNPWRTINPPAFSSQLPEFSEGVTFV